MRMIAPMMLAGLALSAAGCAGEEAGAGRAGTVDLRSATGETMARASVTQGADGASVSIEAAGLQAGTYGVHVHTTGRCDAPAFESAGAHWNPTTRQHGTQNPQGPHQGDLPNLTVGADGRGTVAFVIPGARLTGGDAPMMDADGAAVVVHADPDDYRTDPSGNSGARIACGVLAASS